MVKFYYTVRRVWACMQHALTHHPPQFTDRGLNVFTSAVNFTALVTSRASGELAPLHTFSFVTLPLAPAGALVQGTQRAGSALRTALPGRRLFQAAAGGSYAQASALASFAPLDKNATVTAPPAANIWGSL